MHLLNSSASRQHKLSYEVSQFLICRPLPKPVRVTVASIRRKTFCNTSTCQLLCQEEGNIVPMEPSSDVPKRAEEVAELGSASTDTTLNSLVVRPSNRAEFARQKKLKPEDVVEVLELKDVKVLEITSAISIAVFINLPTAGSKTPHSIAEYVGSFSILRPYIGPDMKSSKVNARLGISDNIRRLGIPDLQSEIAVTLVAVKRDSSDAKGSITVECMQIVYE